MAKVELEPRGEYSPSELIDVYEADKNKSTTDIITLGKKLGLDDPNYFAYELDKEKRGKYYEPTEEGSALRKKYAPGFLQRLQKEYFEALDKINLVKKETDILPGYDGYDTQKFDLRKQPGSRGASKSDFEEMEKISKKIKAQPGPILEDDEPQAKLSFFENLKERFKDPKNRQFLENLGMQLGTNLTRPMNPGENRSLVNQVATSIQGASDKSIVQDKARVEAALKAAQAEKALSEARGGTELLRKARESVANQYPNVDPTSPEYGKLIAQAMRTFGVKDISTAQVNALIKVNELESNLEAGLFGAKDSESYNKKKIEIEALKKKLNLFDIDGSGSDGRNVYRFSDQSY